MSEPRMIGDRYEVGRLLGYGGMAEVHLGRDTRLNRSVAIKILRADLARDPSFQTRFRREAHSAGSLNHPNIVAVYDTGEDHGPDGPTPYIVMEYVDGRTLRDVLSTEGHLDPRRAMQVVAEVCSALDFSHRNGIIHRDIKPGNVMITKAGAIKVMDFGIARAVADGAATVTQTASVVGTAQYLSPEQARGEAVDARSDVYSTGCLLYELLTGHPPFQGDSPVAVAYQHVRESPAVPSASVPTIPRAVDSIVMKALAKNPLNRYQTAAEMRADLQQALANQPVKAEPVLSDEERTQLLARTPATPRPPDASGPIRMADGGDERTSRRGAIALAAVVVLLLAIIGGSAYLLLHDTSTNAGRAKTVTVPELYNLTPAAASDKARQAGLNPTVKPVSDDSCDPEGASAPKGQVCAQDPKPGEVVDVNSSVTISVNGGPANVSVPQVTNLSKDDAIDVLRKANLTYEVKNVNQAADKGQVVDQDPLPFKLVAPQSKVIIMVSTGKTKLPDVSGKTIDEATAYLQTHGFRNVDPTPRYQITTDQSQDGKVKATDPVAGTLVDPSEDRITLIVYKFQLPECSSSPETDGETTGSETGSTSGSSGPTTCTPPPSSNNSSTPGG